MLAYFETLIAPSVPDVVIYRDHADARKFHLLNTVPRIATDAKTGVPLFSYTLYSRSVEIVYASAKPDVPVEMQLGALTMTVDLSVSEEDLAKIREFLTALLKDEQQTPSAYNKLYKSTPGGTEPVLTYADWLSGSVRFDVMEGLGPTFKRSSSSESSPTLHGGNKAVLSASFGSEGAQVMWELLTADSSEGASTESTVSYTLEGLARLPGIQVDVKADADIVYKEIRSRVLTWRLPHYHLFGYTKLAELTKEMTDARVISIEWEDYGVDSADPKAGEIKQQLEQMVLGTITNQILKLFFETFTVQGPTEGDPATTPTHSMAGAVPGNRMRLREYSEGLDQHIGFSLRKTENYRFKAGAAGSLIALLTPEQRRSLVRVVDAGSPEVRVLTVQVITNADFKTDRIANITATLSYRQFDTLVNDWIETSESFVFRTGEEVFSFRTRLARDAEGKLMDFYDAHAQVNYVGVSQSPPAIELKGVTDRALTFSYDRLGYVKVEVQAGDTDWTQIKDIFVDLTYDGAPNQPDAKGTVRLTEQALKGQWTCSKHGASTNGYSYSTRFVYKDGSEQTTPVVRDERGLLIIHDPLVGRLRRTFDVSFQPTHVSNVALKVRYENPPNAPVEARYFFPTSDSWTFVQPLQDGAPTSCKYAYEIRYADGHIQRVDWATLTREQDLPTISPQRFPFTVYVDGTALDWSKWRSARVDLIYRDAEHDFETQQTVRLKKDASEATIPLLAFSPRARSYEYQATFVPTSGDQELVIPPSGVRTGTRDLILDMLIREET
ncbi:MAG: hypothetical protein ABW352_04645 [Polyangiales bacterium]